VQWGSNQGIVTSDNNIFEYCFTSENTGGAWTLKKTDIEDTDSVYRFLGAKSGGAFFVDESDVFVSGSSF